MKVVLAFALSLLASSAYAQTWSCTSAGVACAPGSPNCTCAQVETAPPPVAAAPQVMCIPPSYWNGSTCAMPAIAPPIVVNPYAGSVGINPYYLHQYWHDHPH